MIRSFEQRPQSHFRIPAQEHRLNNVDCLRCIFSFLNLRDRRSIELTCKYWRRISIDQLPLNLSIMKIECERYLPAQYRISFGGVRGRAPFVINRTHGQYNMADANIDRSTNAFFNRFFTTYGQSIAQLDFGGDVAAIHQLEAALADSFTPRIESFMFQSIAEHAFKNLKSISLRSVAISGNVWIQLSQTVERLIDRGRLEKLCLHNLFTQDAQGQIMMPLARSVQRLKYFGVSCAPYALVTSIGAAARDFRNGRRLDGDESSGGLGQLYVAMGQNYMSAMQLPDSNYLSILKAGAAVDLQITIRDYREHGTAAAIAEALRLVGDRLRTIDLRLWWSERSRSEGGLWDLFSTDLDPILESMQEFRLYGHEKTLNNETFTILLNVLSTAPNLRRLSLGKVFARKVTSFYSLGDLIQLESLHLSNVPRMEDEEFLDIINRLINLKQLWLMEAPFITTRAVLQIVDRLEAFEISKCQSFHAQLFFDRLLTSRKRRLGDGPSSSPDLVDNLEFVKIKNLSSSDLRFLRKAKRQFQELGIRVWFDWNGRKDAKLIFKNFAKWNHVTTICPPWYACEYCDADTTPQ